MTRHRPVIKAHQGKCEDENNGQQRIVIIRNGAHEQLDAGIDALIHHARHGGRPGGDRRNHADRRRGGINDIGQLRSGNLMPVRYRHHHRSDRQAVEIIVHEDQDPEQEGRQHGAASCLHMPFGPFAEGRRASRLVHQGHHRSQQNQEHEDSDVPCTRHRLNKAFVDHRIQGRHR